MPCGFVRMDNVVALLLHVLPTVLESENGEALATQALLGATGSLRPRGDPPCHCIPIVFLLHVVNSCFNRLLNLRSNSGNAKIKA